MTHLRKANEISHLWQKFGPNTYPIDLDLITDEVINPRLDGEKLTIKYRNLDKIDGAMIGSTDSNGNFAACVNANTNNTGRKRFTLAHEIGHFMCHRHMLKNFQCTRSMINDFYHDNLEKEANQFAAQLLMPPNRLRDFDNITWGIESLVCLSEKFNCSLQAVGLNYTRYSTLKVAFIVVRNDFVCWGNSSSSAYKEGIFFRGGDEV